MITHWEPVIGLEMHVQLATRSKLFSGAAVRFGAAANELACEVDLALPGTLPVVNAEAIRMAAQFGMAVDGQVSSRSIFARKHYFYPDLPRGFQTTQYQQPIVQGGYLTIEAADGGERKISLTRAHLEEDAGKSTHDLYSGYTAIDLNRAGVALLEVVTEPVIGSAEEAVACLRELHRLVRTLAICDGDMSQGSLRCDVNVSLRPSGSTALGERTEMKNLNSFRFIEKAIVGEIERQRELLDSGQTISRQTLLYDERLDATRPMRSKEFDNDYRYFPDPDLLPVAISTEMLEQWRAAMPELPRIRKQRLQQQYSLNQQDCDWLVAEPEFCDYFEKVVAHCGDPRRAVNWIRSELSAWLNDRHCALRDSPLMPEQLAKLINRLNDGSISGKNAKQLFAEMLDSREDVDAIIARHGFRQLHDPAAVRKLVEEVVAAHPRQVADYRAAAPEKRRRMLGFFVGQVMKRSKGSAKPELVNARLLELLEGD